MAILNALRVPPEMCQKLCDTMTPVNTFRLLLNTCVGTDYELLPDKDFYSIYDYPYDMSDVTSLLNSTEAK